MFGNKKCGEIVGGDNDGGAIEDLADRLHAFEESNAVLRVGTPQELSRKISRDSGGNKRFSLNRIDSNTHPPQATNNA